METEDLEISMDSDLIAKTRELAIQCFGDDSEESLARVLEIALKMRCFWSRSVKQGQQDTDEAITTWEFSPSSSSNEATDDIRGWLFRR